MTMRLLCGEQNPRVALEAWSSPAWITTDLVLTAASRVLAVVSVGPCTYSNASSSGSWVKYLRDSYCFVIFGSAAYSKQWSKYDWCDCELIKDNEVTVGIVTLPIKQ